tara:strand:- start:242 stop:688 length:447 start_codon:yes stop_codon:yes gene_type:complete
MFITKELMDCTWYLKKELGLDHKWAFSSAFELSAMLKPFTLIIHTPESPFKPWSTYNLKNICSYFVHLSREAEGSLAEDLVNAVLRLRKLSREAKRIDITSIANIRGGELIYYVLCYYVASELKKSSKSSSSVVSSFDHLSSWGLPPI